MAGHSEAEQTGLYKAQGQTNLSFAKLQKVRCRIGALATATFFDNPRLHWALSIVSFRVATESRQSELIQCLVEQIAGDGCHIRNLHVDLMFGSRPQTG